MISITKSKTCHLQIHKRPPQFPTRTPGSKTSNRDQYGDCLSQLQYLLTTSPQPLDTLTGNTLCDTLLESVRIVSNTLSFVADSESLDLILLTQQVFYISHLFAFRNLSNLSRWDVPCNCSTASIPYSTLLNPGDMSQIPKLTNHMTCLHRDAVSWTQHTKPNFKLTHAVQDVLSAVKRIVQVPCAKTFLINFPVFCQYRLKPGSYAPNCSFRR